MGGLASERVTVNLVATFVMMGVKCKVKIISEMLVLRAALMRHVKVIKC